MNEETTQEAPEYEFNVDSITPFSIVELHQEGNWLHGLTDTGTRFRHHIPQGKRLNKKEGKYVLEAVEVA